MDLGSQPCAACDGELDLNRRVWWTPVGFCCSEPCARRVTGRDGGL